MGCCKSKDVDDEPIPKSKFASLPATVTPTRTKFQTGKEVVAEVPHSVGPPLAEFRGMTGTVIDSEQTADGRLYEVSFDTKRQFQLGSVVFVKGRKGKIIYGPDEDQELIVRFENGENSDCLKKDEMTFEEEGGSTKKAKIPAEYLRSFGAVAQSTNVQFLTIDQVLNACTVHTIPVFQRRYCWTEQQCTRLWQSVATMRDAGKGTNNHSIGRLMLLEQPDKTRLVLDGQQRLTTLTLLFVALRDRLSSLGDAEAAKDLDGLCTGRLVPTLDDRHDFEQCLAQSCPPGEGHLLAAKRCFAALAEALDPKGAKDTAKAARKKLSSITFVLEDARSVQRVYENLAKRVITLDEARRMGVDLSTCTECFMDGEKQTPSTHWGPDANKLCEEHARAKGLENCEPMMPGVEMSPVDLIRNLVIEHYKDEPAMRKVHAECWSPLEAKAGGTAVGLEQLLKQFLESQGFKIKHRWTLYNVFTLWWRGIDVAESSPEAHANTKLGELLAAQGLAVPTM